MLNSTALKKWHKELNDLVFCGALDDLPCYVADLGTSTWGECHGTILMVHRTLTAKQAKATLLHEMVHQWQFENGNHLTHGDTFEEWRERCKELTGLDL